MSASPQRWSLPAERRTAVATAVVALAAFGTAWALLHRGFYERDQIVDTPVYQRYGDAMLDGEVPYRDFRVEYPPAALPMFVLPAIGDGRDERTFRRNFERVAAFCGLVAVAALALALGALHASPERQLGALGFAALGPLALGSVILTRFDLWPTALMMLALAAILAARERLGLGLLGVAAAAKVFPAVIAPLAVARVWRRRGRRDAVVAAAVFAFARGPAERERFVRYAAACVAAFVALGKVLSPQFLIWLLPLVPLVRGRRGALAGAVLLLALVLTQLWFPYHYWDLTLRLNERAAWLVFARDLVLVALVAVLAWPGRHASDADLSASR